MTKEKNQPSTNLVSDLTNNTKNKYYIEVEDLYKFYGKVHAVDGISLKIKKGEVFAFLGPNGAGKTTTVEIIETIRTPTKGSIRVMGLDVAKNIDAVKKVIGVLPQEFSSFDKLNVRETIEFYGNLYKSNISVDKLMKLMDIEEHAKKLYQHLSGGLKQRVGIAVALVNNPEVVFLDEPTTGLDPQARHEVWRVIAGLKDEGKTVFLTTHYMEEAEELADHIAIIHKGKIIAEGTVDELIEEYGTGLCLTFKDGDGGLVSTIRNMGFKIKERKNHDISISIKDKEELIDLLSNLKLRKVRYKEINVRRSNLEEVFLKLTGEKLRGGEET
ncbi:ABC transporter ATP-binding protein [[Eubacterium] cellulosolvens]